MKLELKHIAPYLPYRLKFEHVEYDYSDKVNHNITTMESLSVECITFEDCSDYHFDADDCDGYNPTVVSILRPLSDLYKEIDGKIGIVELAKIAGCNIDLNKLPINEIETVNIVKNYEVEFEYSSGYYRYFIFRNGSFYYKTGHERRYGQDYKPLPQSNQLDLFTYLFENHYDVFGLIEQNLAIDINTLGKGASNG